MERTIEGARPGCWPSPLSAGEVAQGGLRFGRVQVSSGAVYWSEGRPAENGRTAIMRWTDEDGAVDLIPPSYSARSRVHEYGGGEFLAAGDSLFFINDSDQDVYAVSIDRVEDRPVRRLTSIPGMRFADLALDKTRNRLLAVGEMHVDEADALQVRNVLCAIPLYGNEPVNLVAILDQRFDFYASPRIAPRCDRIAYLAWMLPAMPWDSAELHCASFKTDGTLDLQSTHIAGGQHGTTQAAAFQPEWDEASDLFCVLDTRGFGDLYRIPLNGTPRIQLTDSGDLAQPLWSFNASSYAFLGDGRISFRSVALGDEQAFVCDRTAGLTTPAPSPLTATVSIAAENPRLAWVGMTDENPLLVATQTVETETEGVKRSSPFQIIRRSSAIALEADLVPRPRRIAFPAADGGQVYGVLFEPANPDHRADLKLAPVIINLHGGPTTHAVRGLKLRTAYFTSRGFSWLDLDYAGSTGYGRDFRRRLDGNWGKADVSDTLAAADHVIKTGLADPSGLFVTGGSAGGYTVMMTIAMSNVFRGATSYYGICDLAQLQRTTHKFEHGYLETLLGASLETDPNLYAERSPLTHADRIQTPLLLFQGTDDKVVPRDQSIMIADAIRSKSGSVEYHEFEGEGHGFRRAATISRTLELELQFYQRLLLHTHPSNQ